MKFFTYGTLKRGLCNSPVLDEQKFLGEAITQESHFALYEMDREHGAPYPYPCLKEVDEGGIKIEGELYEISETCLKYLDRIEGVSSGLYSRKLVPVVKDEVHEAWAYIFARAVGGLKRCGSVWPEIRKK